MFRKTQFSVLAAFLGLIISFGGELVARVIPVLVAFLCHCKMI